MTPVNATDIAAAALRLAGIVNRTPVVTSRSLNQQLGAEVYFKCENFQRVGAFKFRGAYNAISQLSREEKAAGVITHSSGNHAQGVALAAQMLGVPAVIVMPENAPAIKREATAAYGARIINCDALERESVTHDLIAQHGYTLVHPYDNDRIIAGQGTAAYELFEEIGPLDLLFVPVGGGGLISGCALAAAGLATQCRVVGVEPELAADANRSWREGKVHRLEAVPQTIADGLRTRFIGERNLAVMRRYVHDMTVAGEEAIIETMHYIWQRLKIVVEPSAAVALAPLLTGAYPCAGKRVGVLLSGGNVDLDSLSLLPAQPHSRQETLPESRPERDEEPVRLLVCDAIGKEALALLRQAGEVDVRTGLNEEQLHEIINRYQAVIVGSQTHISGTTIEEAMNLKAIGCIGGRLDNVDVSAARAFGVEVRYAPGSNTVAIAEHIFSLLLQLASQAAGQEQSPFSGGLAGKTLGIVGFGRIGRQVAQRALAFDMRVVANQPRLTPELALAAGVEALDLHDLLREADFVSLHVPFKAETETLIGEAELALMKAGAYLINIAHTELVDDDALLAALEQGRLAGAALATYTVSANGGTATRPSAALRRHPKVFTARHVTQFISDQAEDAAATIARQIIEIVRRKTPSETLSLDVVPVELVLPHEQIDDKRVARLMERLASEGRLLNPPVVTSWHGRYVILDGATRFTALKRLGYPHIIVQVVDPHSREFALHTWYHVISSAEPLAELLQRLRQIPHLDLQPLAPHDIQNAFNDEGTLCYFLDREGQATIARATQEADRLAVMNELVASYTAWGTVERTLLTDLARLLAQFPQLTAVAVFPQFTPETVFNVAARGELLPAGLTRFLIPGRVLRLNADLEQLKSTQPLPAKRAWLDHTLEEKLARSRLRYYQEPVILLDE
jgi:threo-3-hydroxy-L-aspartate ammonia-lyase